MSTITETQIANIALSHLGEARITSFDENSPAARVVRTHYATARDALLRKHRWNFARKRTVLSQLAEAPVFGWACAYQLPTDLIRVLELNGRHAGLCEADFEIEGTELLTNATEAKIVYISRVDDATKYDALFVEALILKLAIAMSIEITQSITKKQDLEVAFARMALPDAIAVDAREDRPRVIPPSAGSATLASRGATNYTTDRYWTGNPSSSTTNTETGSGESESPSEGGGTPSDHGDLAGLSDDDHPHYALADGSRGAFATTAQGTLAESAVQPGDAELITAPERAKLSGIESGATGDQTDTEIATAYANEVAQISGGEKTAGTETAVRRVSPKDIADMVATHGEGNSFLHAISTTDQSATNSTVLVDTQLVVPLESGKTYLIDFHIGVLADNSTPDIKIDIVAPSGSYRLTGVVGSIGTTTTRGYIQLTDSATADDWNLTSSGENFVGNGFIETSAAGDFKIRFAQRTSDASSTTILAGSWIRFHEVA